MEGPAGDLPSISDKHTHTEKDYCQLVYFHNVIFVFRKLELSLKEKKNGENRTFNTQIIFRQRAHIEGEPGALMTHPALSFLANRMPTRRPAS